MCNLYAVVHPTVLNRLIIFSFCVKKNRSGYTLPRGGVRGLRLLAVENQWRSLVDQLLGLAVACIRGSYTVTADRTAADQESDRKSQAAGGERRRGCGEGSLVDQQLNLARLKS